MLVLEPATKPWYLGEGMEHKKIKYMAVAAVLLLAVFLCRGCYNLFQNTEQEVFTSPQGTNTIIVQYDFVSRPTIYKKTWLGKRKIWAYPGSGFMETVHFGVEWLSEDEIKVNYDDLDDEYDEEFIVAIP